MKRLFAVLVVACLPAAAQAEVMLRGAGATFPTPLYEKWFAAFHEVEPGITIDYESVGSGAGILSITAGRVDFGASDGPLTDAQLSALKVPLVHLPTTLGAVVVTFNVNGIDRLRFDSKIVADIFLGKITSWKDPAFRRISTMPLPDAPITTVHRSDGSGTTYVFTDYLSKASAEWASAVGRGTSVEWPVGLAGSGNQGVAELVKQTPNSIGYVELVFSRQHALPYAGILNRAGQFVLPTLETVTAAAVDASNNMPDDFRVSITNADGPNAYPISSFTWLLVPARIPDVQRGRAMKRFLSWMLEDGQRLAPSQIYAPLPERVVELERAAISRIQVGPE